MDIALSLLCMHMPLWGLLLMVAYTSVYCMSGQSLHPVGVNRL